MNQDRFLFVYIPDLAVVGEVLSYGAFVSLVTYMKDGIRYEIAMSNDEFIERGSIGYEEVE